MTAAAGHFPYFDEAAVARVLEWPPLIDAIEGAMIALSAGRVEQPVRQMVPVPGENGIIAAMPAASDAVGVKVVTLFHDNGALGLPTHQAVILLFDKGTGTPLCSMDGRLITEMRTAAGSAAAARKLAPAHAPVAAILGGGVQAQAHAAALRAVRQIVELRIWTRDAAKGEALAAELDARFVADPAAAVADADMIATTTGATTPVLEGAWLKPGCFVSSVGWNGKDGRELDDAVMANTVIVESREVALDQAGDVRVSGCEIFAEAGEIFAGDKIPPAGATVVYDSVGVAIMDVAAAQLVWDRLR